MEPDDFIENEGLIDDDPALDYILYNEMEEDKERKVNNNKGCLGSLIILLIPFASISILFIYH